MSHLISMELYNWMNERRIESEVAREMGVPVATLLAELCPGRASAKLGADHLVPLFDAIRRIGYGREVQGILYRFVQELKGEELADAPDDDLVPQILRMVQSLGSLSARAIRVSPDTNATELQKIRILLSTELLPVVLQMEGLVATRIESLRTAKRRREPALSLAPQTDQSK
jgi:hypothetical protein